MGFVDVLKALSHVEDGADPFSAEDILAAVDGFVAPDRQMRILPRLGETIAGPIDAPGIEFRNGAYHPKAVEEVQSLVAIARANAKRLRVAGSQHSVGEAVYSSDRRDLRVILAGSLRNVEVLSQDGGGAVVQVGGGCYLGINPADPTSSWSNSLNGQLDAIGFALPILGGISHQTVSGFLQTSSSGGSLRHGMASAVKAFEFVDGKGDVRWVNVASDTFYAVAVSLGLFGVVTHVVMAVEPRYTVEGVETNVRQDDSLIRRRPSGYELESALESVDYLHLNWFPQRRVKRVTQWQGARTQVATPVDPYESELKSRWMNVVAACVLAITSGALAIDPNGPIAERILGYLLRKFVPLDKRETFRDKWFLVLPCDDQVMVDSLIRIIFTEIWLPLEQLTPALDRLTAILQDQRVAGNFAVELYGAGASPFWLSPSFERNVVRVDVFWWAYSFGNSREHFSHFWNALLDLPGARLHWGKHLPDVGQRCGAVTFGPEFLASQYSRFDDWLVLRRECDPDEVFVTDYWRPILGL